MPHHIQFRKFDRFFQKKRTEKCTKIFLKKIEKF